MNKKRHFFKKVPEHRSGPFRHKKALYICIAMSTHLVGDLHYVHYYTGTAKKWDPVGGVIPVRNGTPSGGCNDTPSVGCKKKFSPTPPLPPKSLYTPRLQIPGNNPAMRSFYTVN